MTTNRNVVVISGAANGIGRATADLFVRNGWLVAALDVNDQKLRELALVHGAAFSPIRTDVANRDEVSNAIRRARELGPIRACLNVAGVFPPTTLNDYDVQRYRIIFDVSVLGTVNVTSECVQDLAETSGVVVNLASSGAFIPSPFHLFYSAAKAAVVSLTRSMAKELAPSGIRVNALAPGYTKTETVLSGGRMAGAEETIPLKRGAVPEEMADALWLLAGEQRMPYMTGETILVAGGSPMRT